MKAPSKRVRAVRGEGGGTRGVVRVLLGTAVCAGAYLCTLFGLRALFSGLFDAWGLRPDNLSRAPEWARRLVVLHTYIVYIFAYGLSALAGETLARKWYGKRQKAASKPCLRALLTGAVPALLLTACVLATDSMRFRHAAPSFTPETPAALLLIMAAAVCVETFLRRVIGQTLRGMGCAFEAAVCAALYVLLRGTALRPAGALTLCLMSLCAYRFWHCGGAAASSLLLVGWSAVTKVLFGFIEGETCAIWPLYRVSDEWLTGGAAGPESSLLALAAWAGIAAFLYRKQIPVCSKRLRSALRRRSISRSARDS